MRLSSDKHIDKKLLNAYFKGATLQLALQRIQQNGFYSCRLFGKKTIFS